MLAPQNQQFTVLDSIESTQTAWYDEIDQAIRRSDIIPGDYEYTSATSYGNVVDIHENDATLVDLAPPRFKVISLDNSYITIEQSVDITINVDPHSNQLTKYWYVGYKFAPEIIGQYRIHTNTDLLQTVNHANYEWFMIQNSVSDDVKEKDECYATIDKIRRMDPNVPGTYIDVSNVQHAGTQIKVPINVKIPLSSFLLFYNLKWFAEWMGKITIEIYPSFKNLVICPVVPKGGDTSFTYNTNHTATVQELLDGNPTFHLGFHNINEQFLGVIGAASKTTLDTNASTGVLSNIKFSANDQVANHTQIRTAQYMLQADVYDSIAQRYMQKPLVFPIQTIESKDFTSAVQGAGNPVDSAMTVGLKHCDAAFVVFRKDINTTTCFENPNIKELTFNINGKYYPRESINTLEDVRARNLTLDALNCNRSLITQVPKDLHTSIQPYTVVRKLASATAGANSSVDLTVKDSDSVRKLIFTDGDRSNYFLGIPFADSDDFMGGISTANATIQIQMRGTRPSSGYNTGVTFGQPTMIVTQDCLLKIWGFKSSVRKQIEITHETIEQIALTV